MTQRHASGFRLRLVFLLLLVVLAFPAPGRTQDVTQRLGDFDAYMEKTMKD